MNWFARRMAEPSTRMGGLIIAAAVTHVLTTPPVTSADWFSAAFAVLGGLFGVTTPEAGSKDARTPG